VNRSDFQELAELHLQHAKALLDAQLYSGAYYMCGYVVECALKACICRKTNQFDFYPRPEEARDAWTHKFTKLIGVSDLDEEFEAARRSDVALDVNWKEVDDWAESSRYEPRGQKKAEELFAAVSDPHHGVLACIKRYW
jgi:HEPN domain-containing protein